MKYDWLRYYQGFDAPKYKHIGGNLCRFTSMKKNRYLKKSLIENEKTEIIEISENPRIFLTFSNEFMALTLFFNDNHYDDSQIIIDKHENAIKWSKDLFQNYMEMI